MSSNARLLAAVCNADAAAVAALLDAGAELECRHQARAQTSLHCAAAHGAVAVVRLLLERGADVDAEDEDGATPLHLAAASGHADAASLLLAKSDVDAEDGSGNTPAWAAFAAKQGAVARMLISIGDGDVNAACTEGKSYLHGAAERGALEDAAWLLENGAAVDAKDMRCDTPLHLAAAAGAWDVGRRLVDAGASVNARGKDARTPLHVAACNPSHARGRCSFVELLLQKGADPCALNKECAKPSDLVGSILPCRDDDGDVRDVLLDAEDAARA